MGLLHRAASIFAVAAACVFAHGFTSARSVPTTQMPNWHVVLKAADIKAGKALAARCALCHDISKSATNRIGPPLWNVVGQTAGTIRGWPYYSDALRGDGRTWTYDRLFTFLRAPQYDIPGIKMAFAGMPGVQDRINLIAYLRSRADTPEPLP